jgi:coenzyme F420-reducing hydrogenase beta subunit
MATICSRDKCTGCAACFNVCPQRCISMVYDTEGFLSPEVDSEHCNKCGLCKSTCPVLRRSGSSCTVYQRVYASWNHDESIRFESASGGAFSALATHVLDQNGVVFGAAFDDQMNVKHIAVSDKEELWRLRSSKYVQSDVGSSYVDVLSLLQEGKKVLFSGTPCQVAALCAVAGEENQNLVTCDLLCHGVASPGLFSEYVRYLESCFHAKLVSISFRNKRHGWEIPSTVAVFWNGPQHILGDLEDSFMHGFLHNLTLRLACYQCPYARIDRNGDITLGDFWGIGESEPFDQDRKKGVSLVLVNSERGSQLLEQSAGGLYLEERGIEETRNMAALSRPWPEPKNRNEFFSDYRQLQYMELAEKHLVDKGLKRLIKRVIPRPWLFYLRKYMGQFKRSI